MTSVFSLLAEVGWDGGWLVTCVHGGFQLS